MAPARVWGQVCFTGLMADCEAGVREAAGCVGWEGQSRPQGCCASHVGEGEVVLVGDRAGVDQHRGTAGVAEAACGSRKRSQVCTYPDALVAKHVRE